MSALIQQLVASNDLSESNAKLLDHYVERWSANPYDAVLETHILSESVLADRVADLYNYQRILSIEESDLDQLSFKTIPFENARRMHCVYAVGLEDEEQRLLIVADPSHPEVERIIKNDALKCEIGVAEKTMIDEAVLKHYPIDYQLPTLLATGES